MLKINSFLRLAFQHGNSFFLFSLAFIGLACQSGTTVETPAVVPTTVSQPVVIEKPLIDPDYLLGKFVPDTLSNFVTIRLPYTDRSGMLLRKEAFSAFEAMWKAADKEGIRLKIISSTRTFDQQKRIWEDKWTRFAKEAPNSKERALKILEYSSMPGSSRHHWGTDIDLNDLNNAAFEKGGKYETVYTWLHAHAHEYGFCQPYTAGRTSGYHEEKWHWSYTPLSKGFLESYQKNITEAAITGFKGSETAKEIGIIQNYVLGINTECR